MLTLQFSNESENFEIHIAGEPEGGVRSADDTLLSTDDGSREKGEREREREIERERKRNREAREIRHAKLCVQVIDARERMEDAEKKLNDKVYLGEWNTRKEHAFY